MLRLATVCLFVGLALADDLRRLSNDASERRAYMMEHKQALQAGKARCRADETCPETVSQSRPATACVNGMADIYPCSNVDLLSVLSVGDLCGQDCGVSIPQMTGADSWGWVDPLTNDEYAIMTMSTGTVFVRVTDPENPVVVAYMPGTDHAESLWRDAKVLNGVVYIGSEYLNHGIQVFNLARLRNYNNEKLILNPDYTYRDIGNSHNVVASDSSNTLFVVGATRGSFNPPLCAGGLYALDVSNPLLPAYAGCFGIDGYTHDAQCVVYNGPDTEHVGKEICFNYNEEDLVIADVTDKANMLLISKVNYAGNYYTHQGWITDSQTTLLLDDELDEQNNFNNTQVQRTLVWDVADLDNPELKNIYYSNVVSIDHNQYILGDLTYQANYESGVRILRIDEATFGLSEVGFFDLYPSANTAEFNGIWTVYPYLPSGTLIASTFGEGLFLLKYTGN